MRISSLIREEKMIRGIGWNRGLLFTSLVRRWPSIWGISISVMISATCSKSLFDWGRAFSASHISRPLGNMRRLT